jgi:hypothetical protein
VHRDGVAVVSQVASQVSAHHGEAGHSDVGYALGRIVEVRLINWHGASLPLRGPAAHLRCYLPGTGSQPTCPARTAYPTKATVSISVWAMMNGSTRFHRRKSQPKISPIRKLAAKPPNPW